MLATGDGERAQGGVLLPFELLARTCADHTLHLSCASRNSTHRVRINVAYFVENADGSCRAEQLDCRVVVPVLRFLNYATISE